MSQFVEILSAMMDVRASRDLFFSVLRFKTRNRQFVHEVENVVKEEYVVEREESQGERTTIFEMKAKCCTTGELYKSTTATQ